MTPLDGLLLVGGGFAAGVLNTLAGGGSLITVPLLVLLGLPGTVANGSNRIGILVQNVAAAWQFRAEGVSGLRRAVPVLLPVGLGSVLGAWAVAQLRDETFERLFGVFMLLLLVPTLRGTGPERTEHRTAWPPWVSAAVFFAIGLYGGAFQAGVGLALILALSRSGLDLVRANSVKTVVIAVLTAVAVPVFIVQGQVVWLHALVLAAGFAVGGVAGARLTVAGGERVVRPVLVVSVLALAGRMLGLY
ncbi:MAG: sulfite exporter TauE/SafE family protein [Proteobacteria bacterium]|nr:sulfite exporter TauE/SafE family protein [Pseudomonadota bacterium]